MVYLYDAGGQKLRSDYYTYSLKTTLPLTVSAGDINNTVYAPSNYTYSGTAYVDNKEYSISKGTTPVNGVYPDILSFIRMYNAEGYVTNLTSPQYYYYRKDHLGSNHEVWCANTNTTVQRTNYYPSGLPWYDITTTGVSAQSKKYNGKEWVEMHGYDCTDLGARVVQNSDLHLPTPDPLMEKHYELSPYSFCGGNPVNRIDPDGMDWFQNNQTGDVVYVSNLYQGAEKDMEEGWQWMGANDMFMSDKNDIANSGNTLALKNGGDFQVTENNPLTHDDDQVVSSMLLKGDKATKFMQDRGFDFKPTQQIRYEDEINFEQQSRTHVTCGEKTYITEKSSYIPKGAIEDGYTPLNKLLYLDNNTVNRFQISYTTNIIKKGLNLLQPFIGYHDMRIPTVYPSLSAYPWNNTYINLFLNTRK